MMRKTRLEAGLSLEDVAEEAGFSVERLKAYELGEQAVSFPELEILAKIMNTSIRAFEDKNGPVGAWFFQQQVTKDFLALPEDLQSFVSKPINQPYLEVARRLSEMQADRLRSVAEILLDITL
jgi:transcriptional regulator with XRE-family HTH domain